MPNKLIENLDSLIEGGVIQSYKIEDIDADGNIGKHSSVRNSEMLTLVFDNGLSLKIATFCSGCSENTEFIAGEEYES